MLGRPSSADLIDDAPRILRPVRVGRIEANMAHHGIQLPVGAMIDVPRTTHPEAGPFAPWRRYGIETMAALAAASLHEDRADRLCG